MKKLSLIILVLVSLFLGRGLATPNHFRTHDDLQVFRLNEFENCLRDLELPCRWSANMGKGYGYPYFTFYPPVIYLVPAVIRLLTGWSLVFSLNISALISFPLAALSMYRLIEVMTKKNSLAFLAGILFVLIPYHALNVFVRGVYAENLVWSLTPLLLAEIYLLLKEKKSPIRLGLLGALVLLTHNVSLVMLFPVLSIWSIALLISAPHRFRINFFNLAKALFLSLSLSAFFVFPALLEKNLVYSHSLIEGYYAYFQHFASFKQMLFSNVWGFGASAWGVLDELSFSLGKVYWLGATIAGLILVVKNRLHFKKLLDPLLLAIGISTLYAFFMAHHSSTPLYELVKIFQYVQFPWRYIGMASTTLLIFMVYALHLSKIRYSVLFLLVGVVIASSLYTPYFKPKEYDSLTDSDFVSGQYKNNQQQEHLYDYLPLTVKEVPTSFADFPVNKLGEGMEIIDFSRSSNSYSLALTNSHPQNLTLPVFYYPGWHTIVNGMETPTQYDPISGLITVSVGQGSSKIDLQFRETPIRTLFNLVTLGALLYMLYFLYSRLTYKKVQ